MSEQHRCEVKGCKEEPIPCIRYADDPEPSWICPGHASDLGFCSICGLFWAGIESFDFGPGCCEHCAAEVEEEPNEDDWYEAEDYP